LCWFCKQNCELVKQGVNVWLCPKCRKCLVYCLENKAGRKTYEQLPTNCLKCGWKKKRLSKRERKKIADEAIKSGLSYQRGKESGKSYFAWCSFCERAIVGKQKDKEVKNRNQLRFWTDKVSEERLVCNSCLRGNEKFLKLLPSKYRKKWWSYKSRGMI